MTEEVKMILAEIDKRLEINDSIRKYAAEEHKLYNDGFEDGVGFIKDFIIKNFS